MSARGEGVERTVRQAVHNVVFCTQSTSHPLSFSSMDKLVSNIHFHFHYIT